MRLTIAIVLVGFLCLSQAFPQKWRREDESEELEEGLVKLIEEIENRPSSEDGQRRPPMGDNSGERPEGQGGRRPKRPEGTRPPRPDGTKPPRPEGVQEGAGNQPPEQVLRRKFRKDEDSSKEEILEEIIDELENLEKGERPKGGKQPPKPDGTRPPKPDGTRPPKPDGTRPPRPEGGQDNSGEKQPPEQVLRRRFGKHNDQSEEEILEEVLTDLEDLEKGERPEGKGGRRPPKPEGTRPPRPDGTRPPRPDGVQEGTGDQPPEQVSRRKFRKDEDWSKEEILEEMIDELENLDKGERPKGGKQPPKPDGTRPPKTDGTRPPRPEGTRPPRPEGVQDNSSEEQPPAQVLRRRFGKHNDRSEEEILEEVFTDLEDLEKGRNGKGDMKIEGTRPPKPESEGKQEDGLGGEELVDELIEEIEEELEDKPKDGDKQGRPPKGGRKDKGDAEPEGTKPPSLEGQGDKPEDVDSRRRFFHWAK